MSISSNTSRIDGVGTPGLWWGRRVPVDGVRPHAIAATPGRTPLVTEHGTLTARRCSGTGCGSRPSAPSEAAGSLWRRSSPARLSCPCRPCRARASRGSTRHFPRSACETSTRRRASASTRTRKTTPACRRRPRPRRRRGTSQSAEHHAFSRLGNFFGSCYSSSAELRHTTARGRRCEYRALHADCLFVLKLATSSTKV